MDMTDKSIEEIMAETDKALLDCMTTLVELNEKTSQAILLSNRSFFDRIVDSSSILSQVVQSLEDYRAGR
jgi:hypothetical protein